MNISFNGQSLKLKRWPENHPYKRTEKYLQDSTGKFYSSLYPAGKNSYLFEKDGVYGLLFESEGSVHQLPKGLYWQKFKKAKSEKSA